jgi:tetratricopeptide (TPR) repeat protein
MNFKAIVVLVALCLGVLFPMNSMSADRTEAHSLALEGIKLSDAAAQQLEDTLKQTPEDLSIRTKLLGYYFQRQFQSDSTRKVRQQHALWIIRNHPESEIAGLPFVELDFVLDGPAYTEGVTLWRQQVDNHHNETAILRNAAAFFLLHDRAYSEDLLKKGAALEPNNPYWPERLAHLYSLGSKRQSDSGKAASAAAALKNSETAYALTTGEREKSYMLDDLAKEAYDAGEFDKAKTYAEQLLTTADHQKRDWNTGNAIHHGNLILGRLALKAGDVEKAKQYLIAAGKTPGSPQLNSFGPNMTLAKELLEKGQRDVVVEYFDLCARFWKCGNGENNTLQGWTSVVKQGGIPDFGANLNY